MERIALGTVVVRCQSKHPIRVHRLLTHWVRMRERAQWN